MLPTGLAPMTATGDGRWQAWRDRIRSGWRRFSGTGVATPDDHRRYLLDTVHKRYGTQVVKPVPPRGGRGPTPR